MKNKILLLIACTSFIAASESMTINGKVQYEGKKPRPPKEVNMAADPICGKTNDQPVLNETFLINKEMYMQNVVVWIDNPKHSAEIPETPIVLDQVGCKYIPHVTGIMKGQDLMIKNSDKTMHNIHSRSEVNSNFNFAMPAQSDPSIKNFNKIEDPFYIKCDVHPWMRSWVVVVEHPYWSVTDQDGNYSMNLDSLEPGTYDLCFWHEKWDKPMKKGAGYCSDEYKTTVTIADKSVDAGTQIFKRPTKKK